MDETTVSIHQTIISILSESKDYWPAVMGAAVGSFTAGVIAWWLQLQNLREARKMREDEKLERDRALATAAFLKMGHIHVVCTHMKNHLGDAIKKAGGAGSSEPCNLIQVMANLPSRESLTYKELGLVFRFVSEESFGLILNMNNHFKALLDSFSVFNDELSEMKKIVQSFDFESPEGLTIAADIPENERPRLELKRNALNDMMNSIHEMALKGVKDATTIMIDFEKTLNPAFKLNLGFEGADNKAAEETPQQNNG